MINRSLTKVDIAIPELEPSFQIDGKVAEVFPGSGFATLVTNADDALTVSRGTDGIHFEALRVGDRVNCDVAIEGSRVLYGHQQTQALPHAGGEHLHRSGDASQPAPAHPPSTSKRSDQFLAGQLSLTKEEFIDEHCRRWGVAWADIADFRVAVPSNGGVGWTMVNVGGPDDEPTLHGPLTPTPE